MQIVLDASALSAYLLGERGGEAVELLIPSSIMSAVNAAETATSLIKKGAHPVAASKTVDNMPIFFVPFDRKQAHDCSLLFAITRPHGLSLGDRACLALALHVQNTGKEVQVITTDRAWKDLDVGVDIRVIR